MNIEQKLNDISEIKTMMEKSSKFLSLSGLSGVVAGCIALMGAIIVYVKFESVYSVRYGLSASKLGGNYPFADVSEFVVFSFITGFVVLVLALLSGFYFTYRKAKKQGLSLSRTVTKHLLTNLAIPLVAGGLLSLILAYHHVFYLIAPVTLIFYGLALVNASKFTLGDIRYLGILEILLGLTSAIFVGYTLIFWAFGFGVLHIVYGISMYLKYDR